MATQLPRPIVLAYNNIAASGDDAALQIGQYGLSKGNGTLRLSFELLVVGATASDLQSKIAALDALRGEDGPIVVQLGRELEKNDLVADGSTTVTSATGGFTTAHEGLWLSIRGIGTRRIVTRNSATSVTLSAAVTSGTYRAFLPASLFAGSHSANTFMNGRGTLDKIQGRPENTEYSQLFRVEITGDIPGKGPIKSLNVSVTWDASRRATATLRGEFFPYDFDSDGVVESAKDVHDYYIGTIVTNHLSAYGGESLYELVSETQGYDAPDDPASYASGAIPAKNYTFNRTYKRRFYADATGIIDQRMTVNRTHPGTHGLPGSVGKVSADVTWGANISYDVVTTTGLAAYYASTCRPLIIAAIKLHTGTTEVVVENEQLAGIDHSGNIIGARWTVYLPRLSSKILTYSKTEAETNDDGLELTILWDGKDHTYTRAPEGARRAKTVTVDVTSQSPIVFTPAGSDLDLAGASSVVSGVADGSGIKVSWKKRSSGSSGASSGSEGKWVQTGAEEYSHSQNEVGASLYSGTKRATIYRGSCTRRYVWMVPATPVTPKFEDAGYVAITSGGVE